MELKEIIIELTSDLYTVRKAYKKEQEDVTNLRRWWSETILERDKLKEKYDNLVIEKDVINGTTPVKPKKIVKK